MIAQTRPDRAPFHTIGTRSVERPDQVVPGNGLETSNAATINALLLKELGAVAASGATYITPTVALLIG
ncbi:hypothetical protein LMG28688_07026 [Paraburkholderia caffeinitolerans]|uniref:Uncharacterized protein n=1 Tax=Paraburkholderia caffeinitolerans TaxID=1723730 RepID=A0A6J5H1M9_9BURK|nr:hypothetical protein [Paraburkholderia caffeinitolerans]CAB3809629.1 hypothetical protein LMG28688_07026 [Paraburkholderia caffeinitolerans]